VDVLDADLDIVYDLTREVHDEALLLLQIGEEARLVSHFLHQIFKELHGVLDQLFLKDLELVLLIHKIFPF